MVHRPYVLLPCLAQGQNTSAGSVIGWAGSITWMALVRRSSSVTTLVAIEEAVVALHSETFYLHHLLAPETCNAAIWMRRGAKLHFCLPADVIERLKFVYGGDKQQALEAYFRLNCWSQRKGIGGWTALESLLSGSAFRIRTFIDRLDYNGGDVLRPPPCSWQPAIYKVW